MGYGQILNEILVPVAQRHQPELILVSAGFDGHWRDPLATMGLSMVGFALIDRTLKQLADELCHGRLAFALEGGYDLQVLAQGVLATFALLLGDDTPDDPLGLSPRPEPDIRRLLGQITEFHRL
jgi:acetoin utilization deacetylase AcuC-like enzyme